MIRQIVQILRIARPPHWAGVAVIVLGFAAALLEGLGLLLFIPLLQSLGASTSGVHVAPILDRTLAGLRPSAITAVVVTALCGCILLKNVVTTFNNWLTRNIDGRVAHQLRTRVFEQVLSSGVDYHKHTRRADITATLATNTMRVSNGLSLIYHLAVAFLTFAVFVALMIFISPRLTLIALVFLAVVSAVIRFSTRRAAATGAAVVAENKAFGLRMWESIESLQMIRAFGRERYEISRLRLSSDEVRKRLLTLDLLWALPSPIAEVSITLLIGALVLAADSIGLGIASLAAFLSLLYRAQGPVRELIQSKVALDGFSGAIDDVELLLKETQTAHLRDGDRLAAPLRDAIRLENVWFRYAEGEPWALRDVSFAIPAGKTTAFVGESGAGKSTLLSLLFRFHDPSQGRVLADGVCLSDLTVESWRRQLAVMSQDVQLLNDTVEANIAYGRPDATTGEVQAAAAIAGADAFIEQLPKGGQTNVEDRGLRLSGGQRQRIALARTILRNPDILLLDEATNALDIDSERAFQLALEQFGHRRTVIVIAHRLATVLNADQIVVLSGGQVVEIGAPAELLKAEGQFARMFGLQSGATRSADQ